MMQVSNSTVLITGAAVRIGRVIAVDLAKHGWDVALHYNNSKADIETVAHEIESLGQRAVVLQADFNKPEEVEKLVSDCHAALGPATCLINNSSVFLKDELDTLSKDQWDTQLNVNLKAPVFLSQSFAQMLPQTETGNIINIIDQRVWKLTPLFFSYTISKAALWTATQTLAQALAPRIRVNAIGPGPVLQSVYQTPEIFENHKKMLPLKLSTNPQEIADTIRFILDAPAMTGQMIALDGGQHIAWKTPDVATGEDF